VIPERNAQLVDKHLERLARRVAKGVLKPADELLDIEVGNLKRFRDNGIDRPVVTPKTWARALPAARGLMTITYTRERVLFLADGLAVSCLLACIHRAELEPDGCQVFAFGRNDSPLSLLEFEQASRRGSSRPRAFVERLMAFRDHERASLSAAAREQLEQQDLGLRSRSISELWTLPASHLKVWNADSEARNREAGAALGSFEPEQALDETRWQLLCNAIAAAHRGDGEASRLAVIRLETEAPADGHAAAYVWYLLQYALFDYFDRKPTVDDLQRMARRRHPRFAQVIRGDAGALEDLLRSACNIPADGRRVTGGMFVVLGIAALGVILDDPAEQLEQMKPHLTDWWQKKGRDLVRTSVRSRGTADDASPASTKQIL
jgi:HPt (histidine-containing phosphotransfer) domain-containing protein